VTGSCPAVQTHAQATPAVGPLVSIVINNYNYGRFLAEAIESALAQTYPALDLIVVDDGSSDDSREIIARYRDRVRVVLKQNGGQASALNAGFAASRGEVVLFLDADDTLAPRALEKVVASWNPGVARVQFPLNVARADGVLTGGRVPADAMLAGDLRRLVLESGGYPTVGTTGTAFGRQALEAVMPIPEEAWRREPDLYLLLLTPFQGDVACIAEPLGSYRVHGANSWVRSVADPARLREQLALDVRAEEALRSWAPRLGVSLRAGWLLRNTEHLQARLASLRLEPRAHPFAGDRRWRLAMQGARASLANAAYAPRKRWLFAIWFLITAVAPRRPARALIDLSFAGGFRPRILQRLVQGGSRAAGAGGAGQLERG